MTKHCPLSSVPVLQLPVPAAPAAGVVSEGAGPGALQSRGPLLPTDPTQKLQVQESSVEGMGHWTPAADDGKI